MEFGEGLSRVRALSNDDLLVGLNGLLRATRRTAAEVVAHLSEVEERRLHLLEGHASMFSYCVHRLRMSEDEAYRRVEVARLARRFPRIFEMLADGRLSLSVAALLKSHLTDANHSSLLNAVSSKTVWQAREVLAAWFPRPDVPASIRKLPVRPVEPEAARLAASACSSPDAATQLVLPASGARMGISTVPAASLRSPPEQSPSPSGVAGVGAACVDGLASPGDEATRSTADGRIARSPMPAAPAQSFLQSSSGAAGDRATPERALRSPAAAPAPSSNLGGTQRDSHMPALERGRTVRSIEPLSPERYKVQLTANAALKQKLELARDLLRHAIPSGDLAAIIERALDLLLEQTMKRRFAVTLRPKCTASPRQRREASASERSPTSASPIACAGAPTSSSTVEPRAERPSPVTFAAPSSARALDPSLASPSTQRGSFERPSPIDRDAAAPPTLAESCSERPWPTPCGAAPPSSSTLEPSADCSTSQRSSSRSRQISSEVRRAVFARDEGRCAWRGPDGMRCTSRAWLEHDHAVPFGRGGDGNVSNIRLFCRSHNQLAAELAYGQSTIATRIARRRNSPGGGDHVGECTEHWRSSVAAHETCRREASPAQRGASPIR